MQTRPTFRGGGQWGSEAAERLAVTTATVAQGDAASGYYDRGQVRILVRERGSWIEETITPWEE
jgi:hypothetical protein